MYRFKTSVADRNRRRIDWVVAVTNDVPESNRQQLRQDGAIVVPVQDVGLPSWIKIPIHRWKDQFTKLRLIQMTQYTRLLFIDADSLLTRPIDDVFDELAVREPKRTVPDRPWEGGGTYVDEYVFAARPDNGYRQGHDHVVPPDPMARSDYFNAGFWVTRPSEEMFSLFMHVMALNDSFPSVMMEQSMLNHIFRHDGPMPWEELNWRWNANYPNARDLAAGVRCLHQKFWQEGDEHLRSLWHSWRARMENYYRGIEALK
ncbi:glycosyl transferase family 8 family, putative [Metarhizium acridum CQMa 102]|uniref:Glycosyl transferase family 8 family, putative n=1 Tax=Metarhizium acridum (strain CQMa 102) TaxID=655827 RepID=E9EHM1_METAQ|nr:glycosyl transferase family 8 family, putative [Metarhizium acridum CQMa 102]EFY84586.1 glycosyl transferase family 8 family, putative [Metarhizium acridum CQMa 102]